MREIRCIWEAGAVLGEGPMWDSAEGVLYWVDIKGRTLNRYRPDDESRKTLTMPGEIGCVALREGGGMVGALRSGLCFIDPVSGEVEIFATPEENLADNRFNDGKCDRSGRWWVGSMDDNIKNASGSLYRVSPSLKVERVLSGFVVTNGIGWSPDNKTMYFTDSENRTILAFDFDISTGHVDNRRTFVQLADGAGLPDGLTVDAEGGVWSAHWDGWKISRYDPDGSVERVIEMPVPRPTSCIFGGTGLDLLYVSSASGGADCEAPLSGGLFEIRGTGITGLDEPRFGG